MCHCETFIREVLSAELFIKKILCKLIHYIDYWTSHSTHNTRPYVIFKLRSAQPPACHPSLFHTQHIHYTKKEKPLRVGAVEVRFLRVVVEVALTDRERNSTIRKALKFPELLYLYRHNIRNEVAWTCAQNLAKLLSAKIEEEETL